MGLVIYMFVHEISSAAVAYTYTSCCGNVPRWTKYPSNLVPLCLIVPLK